MNLDRAAKFGSVGALGAALISLGTYGVMWLAWTDRISGSGGTAIGLVVLVSLAGTAITILFLFVVIGAFLDRELEARGVADPEE